MTSLVLIAPDKFKGTLTAAAAARAIGRGWLKARPADRVCLLPISDGGDGFGEAVGVLLKATPQKTRVVDAAHRTCIVSWWWEPETQTAIVESARVVGLAMLPPGTFHPFELDTFGLGELIRAADVKGAKRMIIGIGGTATNDGGFGMARALGWQFLDRAGNLIVTWTDLYKLARIHPPARRVRAKVVVAVDVQNPLLGARGATRVYGPQKGLRVADMPQAERCLRRLALVMSRQLRRDLARRSGAGAAGGLGFGLAAFLGARLEPGFALFARHAGLLKHLRAADLVITGEGSIDRSSVMGKGTGELAALCRKLKIPCIVLAGVSMGPRVGSKVFSRVHALVDLTIPEEARSRPAFWLERLAAKVADSYPADSQPIKINRATPRGAARLTRIAFAAKRHWGYPEAWLEHWRNALTVTPEFVGNNETYAAAIQKQIVGFYALSRKGKRIHLAHLWVLPAWMGKGVGRGLFQHAVKRCRTLGHRRLEIESDPNAEGFYQKMGARRIGTSVSTIKRHRRQLPVLIYETAENQKLAAQTPAPLPFTR